MVTINRITPQVVPLYAPSGTYMGDVNDEELMDFRTQCCKENVEGYYIVFNDEQIKITTNGDLEKWPYGLFDIFQIQFANLIKLRRAKQEGQ